MTDLEKLEQAYNFFNERLFQNRLTPAKLVIHNERGCYGYFRPNCLRRRQGDGVLSLLGLNPVDFDRPDLDILATLAHEMTHDEQLQYGRPSKGAYHNQEWVKLMQAIGLEPFNNKDPQLQTGISVHHSIVPDGPFEVAANWLLETGWSLEWKEIEATEKEKVRAQAQRKIKYSCPVCHGSVWGRRNLVLACGCQGDKYWEMEVT